MTGPGHEVGGVRWFGGGGGGGGGAGRRSTTVAGGPGGGGRGGLSDSKASPPVAGVATSGGDGGLKADGGGTAGAAGGSGVMILRVELGWMHGVFVPPDGAVEPGRDAPAAYGRRMRDISFLEWFLLGMPVEWFAVTAVVGGGFLVWNAISTTIDRWRREAREGREQRDHRDDPGTDRGD